MSSVPFHIFKQNDSCESTHLKFKKNTPDMIIKWIQQKDCKMAVTLYLLPAPSLFTI